MVELTGDRGNMGFDGDPAVEVRWDAANAVDVLASRVVAGNGGKWSGCWGAARHGDADDARGAARGRWELRQRAAGEGGGSGLWWRRGFNAEEVVAEVRHATAKPSVVVAQRGDGYDGDGVRSEHAGERRRSVGRGEQGRARGELGRGGEMREDGWGMLFIGLGA
ncbi:hypothetical protein [Oryza sativa Japonica Group]|uniref:Uncharacterized protein OJ1123_G09.14 n=1 Tax=Oryza sativa subsp. japonica TaxID=39947 RepID=Q5VNJ3_ORYSJ|nr:hypothetical protein [Oryza sativa Japonica Group]